MSNMNQPPEEPQDLTSNQNEQGQEDDSFSLGLDQEGLRNGDLGDEFAAESEADP